MQIDVYTSSGAKKGTAELPATLFEAPLNRGLMHQAVVMQQANRRRPVAVVKTRGEVVGSTRKIFQQKGTGRARRGPVRSPVMKGGGKAFGPRPERNYVQRMPRKMRHAALRACLSFQAKHGAIVGLEGYPAEVKTKSAVALLQKLPVQYGRRILIVTPAVHEQLKLSVRNIPNVSVITAAYLSPEDVLAARHIVFFVEAIAKAEEVFCKKGGTAHVRKEKEVQKGTVDASEPAAKKPVAKKKAAPKAAKKKSSPSK